MINTGRIINFAGQEVLDVLKNFYSDDKDFIHTAFSAKSLLSRGEFQGFEELFCSFLPDIDAKLLFGYVGESKVLVAEFAESRVAWLLV